MKKLVVFPLILLTVAVAMVFLSREEGGPIPSEASLAKYGLAVWPADTFAEAQKECADAESWRLDPRETARRFGREVLNYPTPTAGGGIPVRDHVRYLIGSRKLERQRVFLGSVIDLRRYGRCWYVVQGQPRESAWLEDATVGFIHHSGEPKLLISRPGGIPEALVGYGRWDRQIPAGPERVVLEMPHLDPGATGHVIYLDPDRKGVSEYVHTERLGAVPSLKEGEVMRALEVGEVVDNPNICSGQASPFRNGKAVVRYLFQWRFDALLEQVDGFPTYNRRKATLVRPPDRWRVIVDDAMLDLTIPEIAGRCWRLVSMVPRSGIVIREFRVGPRSATFDLDWGNADSALFDFAGLIGGGVLARTDDRITFPRQAESDSDDVPTYALVVLYRNEHIVAAQYGLYGP